MEHDVTYRAAVVGCGRIGCAFDDDASRGYVSTHAGAYVATPGVELVALVDVDEERLERYGDKFRVAGRYRVVEQMLEAERPHVVSVCTTSQTHESITRLAAEAGTPLVFCEKPLAASLAEADSMIEICRAKGTVLVVDHQRRFDRFHREVAAYVKTGGLGRIQQATCYYTAGVANTGTHLLDLLCMLLGAPAWVEGRISANASGNPNDPNVDGWLGFEGGCVSVLQACDVSDYTIFEVNLLGSHGRLRVGSHGFSATFEEGIASRRFAGYKELMPAPSPVDASGGREFMLQAVEHLTAVLDGVALPVSTGEDGRQALELVTALRLSAEGNAGVVQLPLSARDVRIASR